MEMFFPIHFRMKIFYLMIWVCFCNNLAQQCGSEFERHKFGLTLRDFNVSNATQEDSPWLTEILAEKGLLFFPNQIVSPKALLKFAKLFPWDKNAPHENHYGPIGDKEREILMRWKIPSVLEVQLQGFGEVRDHYGLNGSLDINAKATREFHADGLHELQNPPFTTCMHCIESPTFGGETLFINANRIYELLPESLKCTISQIDVVYQQQPLAMHRDGFRAAFIGENTDANLGFYDSLNRSNIVDVSTKHPMVFTHAMKSKKSVIVAPMWVHHLENVETQECLEHNEGQRLIEKVLRYGEEHIYVHSWNRNDVVCWDNTQMLHSATQSDMYGEGPRLNHRVRLAGPYKPNFKRSPEMWFNKDTITQCPAH